MSDVRLATEEECAKFKSVPCDHTQLELLVYDIPGYMYDSRHCGVCHKNIGWI